MTQSHPGFNPIEYGIPWLDAQHARIIELTNSFHHRSQRDRCTTVRAALMEVLEHCAIHFEAEEELMREVEAPALSAHAADHARLIENVDALAGRHLVPSSLAEELPVLLGAWLRDHLGTHDADLGQFLAEHPTRVAVYVRRRTLAPAFRREAHSG